LDVAQLEALLTRTFSIGLDVGRGREKVALVRLRLSKTLLGAAETQPMAAEALAIERGVATKQIAAAEGLALHAAAFNEMPNPVLHLAARAMGVVTCLAALEPGPRAPGADVLLDAALQAATGLQQLLAFRHAPDGLDGDMQPLGRLGAGQQKIIASRHRASPLPRRQDTSGSLRTAGPGATEIPPDTSRRC